MVKLINEAFMKVPVAEAPFATAAPGARPARGRPPRSRRGPRPPPTPAPETGPVIRIPGAGGK